MSPPIYTPDGSEVSEIVLPDGSTASEVIGPDGTVVFEAGPDIPDSVVDNFEEILYEDEGKTLSDYYTEVNNFARTTDRSQEGSYSVRPTSTGNRFWIVSMDDNSKNDLLPQYPQAGDTVVWYHRAETTGTWSALNTLTVGLQSHTDGTDPDDENGYQLQADYANDEHRIAKDGTVLTTQNVSFSNYTQEWLKSEFVWGSGGSLTYTVYDSADNQINQLTATDSTYSSGGIGYTASVDSVGDFHADNIQVV